MRGLAAGRGPADTAGPDEDDRPGHGSRLRQRGRRRRSEARGDDERDGGRSASPTPPQEHRARLARRSRTSRGRGSAAERPSGSQSWSDSALSAAARVAGASCCWAWSMAFRTPLARLRIPIASQRPAVGPDRGRRVAADEQAFCQVTPCERGRATGESHGLQVERDHVVLERRGASTLRGERVGKGAMRQAEVLGRCILREPVQSGLREG